MKKPPSNLIGIKSAVEEDGNKKQETTTKKRRRHFDLLSDTSVAPRRLLTNQLNCLPLSFIIIIIIVMITIIAVILS